MQCWEAQVSSYLIRTMGKLGYVLRASDQRARASMSVQAIGAFVSYVTATGY